MKPGVAVERKQNVEEDSESKQIARSHTLAWQYTTISCVYNRSCNVCTCVSALTAYIHNASPRPCCSQQARSLPISSHRLHTSSLASP